MMTPIMRLIAAVTFFVVMLVIVSDPEHRRHAALGSTLFSYSVLVMSAVFVYGSATAAWESYEKEGKDDAQERTGKAGHTNRKPDRPL